MCFIAVYTLPFCHCCELLVSHASSFFCTGKFISFFQNLRFFTGGDDNAIQAHSFKEGQADGFLTRFTAPVTHMCFSADGKKVLAGSRCVIIPETSFVIFINM